MICLRSRTELTFFCTVKQWNNRLPLTTPLKTGSKPYVESRLAEKAISLDESIKAGYVVAPASQGEKDAEGEWAGRKVLYGITSPFHVASANQGYSFAITYINGYGESTISDWCKGVEIPTDRSESAPVIVSRDLKA